MNGEKFLWRCGASMRPKRHRVLMPFEVKPAFPSWSFLEGGSPLLPHLFQGQLMPNPKIDVMGAEPLNAVGDKLGACHPVRPLFAVLGPMRPEDRIWGDGPRRERPRDPGQVDEMPGANIFRRDIAAPGAAGQRQCIGHAITRTAR